MNQTKLVPFDPNVMSTVSVVAGVTSGILHRAVVRLNASLPQYWS